MTCCRKKYLAMHILTTCLFALLVSINLISPERSWAGINSWGRLALEGRTVSALTLDPSEAGVVYAGTASGEIFKCIDSMCGYNPQSGLGGTGITDIIIAPTTPKTLYAASKEGVFKSIDGGSTWNAINSGLTNLDVSKLSLDPVSFLTIFAATGDGVYRSIDGGTNWVQADSTMAGTAGTTLVISPMAPETIFLGTKAFPDVVGGGGGKISRSRDSGDSWNDVYTIQPWFETFIDGYIRSLATTAISPGTVYAGIDGMCQSGGVLKSTDDGTNWIPLDLLSCVPDLVDPCSHDPNCHALIIVMPDPCPIPKVRSLATDPSHPSTVYAGSNKGLWISTDSGLHWREKNNGLGNYDMHAIAVSAGTQTTLYAGTSDGIYTMTWIPPDGHAPGTGNPPTIADALRVLRIVVGLAVPDVLEWPHYDVAPLIKDLPMPNGSIDINDALLILKNVVGLVTW